MTKTLEERVREFCRETPRLKEESGVAFHTRLLSFARGIHNAAIDTTIGNLPEEMEINSDDFLKKSTYFHQATAYNTYRKETLQTLLKMKKGV